MDRWLCAALLGYALSFTFSKPIDIEQWLAAATLVAFIAWRLDVGRQHALLLGLVLCGIGWGSGNTYLHQQQQISANHFGQTVPLQVEIEEITQVSAQFWRIEGRVIELNHQVMPQQPKVRLNWYEPPATSLTPPQAGTLWAFSARLKAPQGIRNDGGFLYHRYLVSRNIQALGSIRSGIYVSGTANYRQRLFNQLHALQQQLSQYGVLLALTLGERQGLTDQQWLLYQRTGLAHLIAISGLHLSLVAGGILALSRIFGRYWGRKRSRRETFNSWVVGIAVALMATFLYAALAGFATATLRAFAMFAVVILHKHYAVYTPPSRVLLRAVAVVVLCEPMAMLQPGFWLSVCAVASILVMHWRWPIIRGRWQFIRSLWRLELVLTLALWPLTALWFGGLPLLAPLINLVVVPVVALWVLPLSLFGLLLLVLQQQPIAAWVLRCAEMPLNWLEPLLQRVADAPWQWLPAHVSGSLSGLALLLLAWLWPWHGRWKLLCSLVFIGVLLIQREVLEGRSPLALHVLDVDQGTAVVVAQGQRALLVDTGANWELGGNMAERAILPFLNHHQLQPELGFVSHTDNDHGGGVAAIKQRYPGMRWLGSHAGLPCVAGQRGQWGKVTWSVLHPRNVTHNADNDDSCVLLLDIAGQRVLLPGDISYRAERSLLAHSAAVQADILLLGHHGSNSSSEDYFLQAVNPQLAIASRGRNNAYGMVAEPVKQRLQKHHIELLDTALGGQITIRFNTQGWQVSQPWAAQHRAWFDADN